MARCPHIHVQQFTEICLDCNRSTYETDRNYLEYLKYLLYNNRQEFKNYTERDIERLEIELGIKHPGNQIRAKYIEALNEYTSCNETTCSVFLAGGITGCINWQDEMVKLLSDQNITIINPRRKNFPIDDPSAAKVQIEWEFRHLKLADIILFWFPCETLCPIALYELGFHVNSKIFVGTHPDYKRKEDVIIQLGLACPYVKVVHSLTDLAKQVKRLLKPF